MNSGPLDDQTVFDHLNTERVRYSDPHCVMSGNMIHKNKIEKWKLATTNFINQLYTFEPYHLLKIAISCHVIMACKMWSYL